MADSAPLPNFIIIGAHRAATRWLRVNLSQHPDVFMTPRETGFFADVANMDRVWSGALPDYRKFFDGWDNEPLVGESDPAYFRPATGREVAWRINGCLPGVKLVLILRDPVDRYFSAMYDAIKKGLLPAGTDLNRLTIEDLQRLDVLGTGAYEVALGAFLRLFEDRLKVLFFDDIVADAGNAYDEVLEHLGAARGFRPAGLEQRLFTSDRISKSVPAITAENCANIARSYAQSVENVETLLGRPVPSSWRKTAAADS